MCVCVCVCIHTYIYIYIGLLAYATPISRRLGIHSGKRLQRDWHGNNKLEDSKLENNKLENSKLEDSKLEDTKLMKKKKGLRVHVSAHAR